jgi:hypothetical protein
LVLGTSNTEKNADFCVLSDEDVKGGNCYSNLGNAFESKGNPSTFLAGSPQFTLDDFEVYSVTDK